MISSICLWTSITIVSSSVKVCSHKSKSFGKTLSKKEEKKQFFLHFRAKVVFYDFYDYVVSHNQKFLCSKNLHKKLNNLYHSVFPFLSLSRHNCLGYEFIKLSRRLQNRIFWATMNARTSGRVFYPFPTVTLRTCTIRIFKIGFHRGYFLN